MASHMYMYMYEETDNEQDSNFKFELPTPLRNILDVYNQQQFKPIIRSY